MYKVEVPVRPLPHHPHHDGTELPHRAGKGEDNAIEQGKRLTGNVTRQNACQGELQSIGRLLIIRPQFLEHWDQFPCNKGE